ncbi:MAG: helix-turn-helix transcriptional regulator [Candidatus Omnitrophica bacterium]|nr:helix-turn-helix transcriptional regulator [Candidatus Omnitrophota bacterium]
MRIRTCIRRVARERGTSPAELARRLKWYRSNLSAADAGRRSLSLRALARLATVLGCSPGELLEFAETDRPVFRQARLNAWLAARDAALTDGVERGWVHAVWLAWQRHYGQRR